MESKGKIKLFEYCFLNGVKLAVVAREVGVSPGAFCHYVNGRRKMPGGVAVKVRDFTSGKVQVDDWYD